MRSSNLRKMTCVVLSIGMLLGPLQMSQAWATVHKCCAGPCGTRCFPNQKVAPGAENAKARQACLDGKVSGKLSECQTIKNHDCKSPGIPNGIQYVPAQDGNISGLPSRYTSLDGAYAERLYNNTRICIWLEEGDVTFVKVGAAWIPKLRDNRGPAAYKLTPAQGDDDFSEDFVVEEQGVSLPRKYTFKGFDGVGSDDGKLWKIEQAGGVIEYTRGAGGKVSSATDAYGRTTHYYYTGSEYTQYIVNCSAGNLTDQYGPVTKLVYTGARVTEVWEGTPIVATPTYTNDAHYDWKKTVYWFDGNGFLKYIVEPAYSSGLSGASNENDVKDKASTTYIHDENGKVTQAIGGSCSSCSGSTTGGEKFSEHGPVEDLCPGSNPTGLNAVTKQVDMQHLTQPTLGGDVTWNTDEKVQMNEAGQLIIRLTVMNDIAGTTADPVVIEKHLYSDADDDSSARPQYIYYYQGVANAVESATLVKVVKYEYDANGFEQYEKVSSDGQNWVTKKHYDRTSTGRVTKSYVYKDNNTALATDYAYDSEGRITQVQEPTVTINLDKAGGQSYRPTTSYTYTDEGDVDTETDPSGVVTKYYYGYNDDNNTNDLLFQRTKVVVDYGDAPHLNLTTLFTYTVQNNQWRLTSVTDPAGEETNYAVDSWGRTTQATSPLGYKTLNTYDLNNRVTQVERRDTSDHTLGKGAMDYDVFGNVMMEKQYADPSHYFARCYHRDNGGHMRKVWTRVYDAVFDGASTGPTSGTMMGNVTEYTYQHTTNLVTQMSQGARSTSPVKVASYEYDVFGQKTKERRYRVDDNSYNDVDYAYDFQGRLTSVDGPADAYTAYTYDERDLTTQVDQRDGSAQGTLLAFTKTYYDEASRVYKTEVVNPDHTAYVRATNYYLDQAGRLCRTSDPGDHQTDYDYDTAGRMIKTTDPLGNVVLYTLDPDGSRTLVTVKHKLSDTPTWRIERVFTWFDNEGRTDTVANFGTNSPGQNWAPQTEPVPYNYANWPSKPSASDVTALVTKYAYGYDCTYGQFVQVTDAAAMEARSFSDILGRTTRTIEDYGGIARTTTYAYDTLDTYYYDSITAENGNETDQVTKYWRIDSVDASRVTKVTYPDSGEVTYAFRRDGTPNTRIDQRSWTTTYTCDAAGRVTAKAVTGTGVVGTKNVGTTYDALGRVTQVLDDNGKLDGGNPDYDYSKVTRSYAWDDDSAEMTVTETNYFAGSQIGAVASVYNTDGERTKLTYPNSRYVTYTYDADHRMDQIQDEASNVLADYDYKGGYLQDRKLNSDALRLTFKDQTDLDGYDAFGRMVWMRHYKVSNSADVVKLTYAHDYVGTPKYQEDLVAANADELYTTDALHRLTSFKRGNLNGNKDDITDNPLPREQNWTLQHVGNWDSIVSKTGGNNDTPYDARTHNTVNEITGITPQGGNQFSVTSDAAGNLTFLPDRADPTHGCQRYTYDYRNRLIKAEHTNNYDAGTPTWTTWGDYYYDALNRRVAKQNSRYGANMVFLYDGWRIIEEQMNGHTSRQYVYGGLYLDELLIMDLNTDSNQDESCTDAGGSARWLYCQNNNYNVAVVTYGDGTEFRRTTYDPYGYPTNTGDLQFHFFQGQFWDYETELYYFRNRYYSPTLGRFLQRDPLRYRGGMSLYEYGNGRPISATDPTGLIYKETIDYVKYGQWQAATGKSYQVEAQRTDDPGCCTNVTLWYEFEWRSGEQRQRVEWHYHGSGVRTAGEIMAGIGGAAVAFGVGDDITIIGIADDPITVGGGAALASAGVVVYVLGWVETGVDWIVNDLPENTDEWVAAFWEWRNLSWHYRETGARFICTGNEILGADTKPGSRPLLPGKKYPEDVPKSGRANGTFPGSK